MSRILILLVFLVFLNGLLFGAPRREYGVSAHLAPGKEPRIFGVEKAGFVVSVANKNLPPTERPFFAEPENLVDFFLQQTAEIKENGIWVVTTDPDAYSESEFEKIEILKRLCSEKKIVLFFCRGRFLPDGWLGANIFSLKDSDKIYERLAKAKELENKAIAHAKNSEFEKAIEYFTEALNVSPCPERLLQQRGIVYLTKQDFNKAIEDFTRAMELNSASRDLIAQCCNDRAVAYFQSGQYEKSWQDVRKANELGLRTHPGFLAALRNKGFGK